ncbi:helix-turn-helix domain-containing protein [Chelativorans alearense]|uniref:helix-turn-helix domain-containing protein n=1 Tax=Chelativorans alearense TaxID=2681495 RepID=UPI0013CF6CED|nr:helix-turn-helix domain-containing protein [Chelativorans alearense]
MDTQQIGMTIDDAVANSGIGRTKIFEAIKTGQLKARKFGRRTVILTEDLADFLKSLPVREAA